MQSNVVNALFQRLRWLLDIDSERAATHDNYKFGHVDGLAVQGILIFVSKQHKASQLKSIFRAIFCRSPMSSIEKRVSKIFETRRITRKDQAFLMAVFASGKISTEDEALINKIYEALNTGRLRVVD